MVHLTPAKIVVDGVTVYSTADISKLTAPLEGHEVALSEIYKLAAALTAKYRADGYILSRVIVPPQQFSETQATVHLLAIEGYVKDVTWPDQAKKYGGQFQKYSDKITDDRPLQISTLERYLLLANDLPGLSFRSTLQPADDQSGAAILGMDMTERPISGQVTVNNRGSQERGPVQFIGSIAFNNLLRSNQGIGFTFATVPHARQLLYGAVDLREVLNSEGLTLFLSPYFDSGFPDLPALNALDYRSKAYGFEGGLSYPIIRSRQQNLTAFGIVFAENYEGKVSAGVLSRDRLRGFRARLAYDSSDSLQGVNQLLLTYSQGIEGAGATANGQLLASRAVGRVDFSKFNLTLSRTQFLPYGLSLYAGIDGQFSFNPLQPVEQCTFGGERFGRAYDPSSFNGDRCLAEVGELRLSIPTHSKSVTGAQIYGYADHGDIWTLDAAAGTPSHTQGTSVGAGLRVDLFTRLALSGEVGSRLNGGFSRNLREFFSATLKF